MASTFTVRGVVAGAGAETLPRFNLRYVPSVEGGLLRERDALYLAAQGSDLFRVKADGSFVGRNLMAVPGTLVIGTNLRRPDLHVPLTPVAGEVLDLGEVYLPTGGRLLGRIVDGTGAALGGFGAKFLVASADFGARVFSVWDGRIEGAPLPAGEYLGVLAMEGHLASPVTLEVQENRDAEFAIRAWREARLTVIVAPDLVGRASVSLEYRGPHSDCYRWRSARTELGADNVLHVVSPPEGPVIAKEILEWKRLPPGEYRVVASEAGTERCVRGITLACGDNAVSHLGP
jgi:hypothetical protein